MIANKTNMIARVGCDLYKNKWLMELSTRHVWSWRRLGCCGVRSVGVWWRIDEV